MKKELLKFLVLAMLAVGAGPVSGAVWQWSRTATSNATADSTINWAEGMSPSSVNDSARSMMARIADWRDDISGSIASAGTSTAYTLTSHQTFDTLAHMDGASVAFTAHATNGASPTLAVDGLAAKSLVTTSGTTIPAGTLIANTPYVVTYNNANNEFRLQGGANSYNIPIGGLLAYTLASAPSSNFILPAGQCISTITYSVYWGLQGSPAPGSCAANQFQVHDLRGRVLAALDNLNGTAANRLTSTGTGCGSTMTAVGSVCANGNQSVTLSQVHVPAHTHSGTTNNIDRSLDHNHTYTAPVAASSTTGGGGFAIVGTVTATVTGGASIGNLDHLHTFTTDTGSGSAQPVPTVQPTMAVTYLLRVI